MRDPKQGVLKQNNIHTQTNKDKNSIGEFCQNVVLDEMK